MNHVDKEFKNGLVWINTNVVKGYEINWMDVVEKYELEVGTWRF